MSLTLHMALEHTSSVNGELTFAPVLEVCNEDDHVLFKVAAALKENDDFFADYANRYAELSSTVFSCDSMHNLLTSMTNEIIGEMPAQIALWGGTMTEWQENIDSLHAFIDSRCASVIDALVDCDPNFTGPYELTLLVDPPGSGKIELSSVTPSVYPYTTTYFGNIPISLNARLQFTQTDRGPSP